MIVKMSGKVVSGNKIGRKLGFPTANIIVDRSTDVRDGVYAARAMVGDECFNGMANIGYKPTISGGFPVSADAAGERGPVRLLEINLFGFDGDLYGKKLEVELLEFIRPEKSFGSLEELKTMVDEDRRKIEKYFKII